MPLNGPQDPYSLVVATASINLWRHSHILRRAVSAARRHVHCWRAVKRTLRNSFFSEARRHDGLSSGSYLLTLTKSQNDERATAYLASAQREISLVHCARCTSYIRHSIPRAEGWSRRYEALYWWCGQKHRSVLKIISYDAMTQLTLGQCTNSKKHRSLVAVFLRVAGHLIGLEVLAAL
jgi:hypothetical protein